MVFSHKEYTGVVSEVPMLDFLYRQTHPDTIKVFKLSNTINETQKLDSFLTLENFVVLKCSWKVNKPLNKSSTAIPNSRIANSNLKYLWDRSLGSAFDKVAVDLKGSVSFVAFEMKTFSPQHKMSISTAEIKI